MYGRSLVLGATALLLAGTRAAGAQVPVSASIADLAQDDTLVLSLAEAQRLALSRSPTFLADRQEYDIARGQLTQARVYNLNPELEFEAPGAGTAGGLGEYEVRLSQEVEWAGQRGLRIRAASHGVSRAESAVRDAARRTLADASTAFYAALSAQRRLEVVRELSRLNDQLLGATRIQAREGEISAMEANLAEIEAGRARAQVLAARREATSAILELQRLTGLPPDQMLHLQDSVPPAPDAAALDPDSLIALALARRPDYAAATRGVDQLETLTRLARREAIPDLRLGIIAERTERPPVAGGTGAPAVGSGHESPRIGLAVSVPVPLFDRNQGLIAQRAAQTDQARLSRAATELAVRTEVADAYRAYLAAIEEAAVYERDVLQPARTNQQLLEIAYRAGKVGLPTLVLLRNQLLDAELGYWEAWLAARRALVALQASTATMVSDLDLNPAGDR